MACKYCKGKKHSGGFCTEWCHKEMMKNIESDELLEE